VTFSVAARSYERYMGRYSTRLAAELVSFAGIEPGMRVLDVGCGPGALAAAVAVRTGARNVAAADPSEPLLAACAERVRGIDARVAAAERLPWADRSFDAVVSQLVLNFVPDADAALGEMRRLTRPGGRIASCTWDYARGMQMLRVFWDAALELDPDAPDEGRVMRYCTEGELADLWTGQGLVDVATAPLEVGVTYGSFADYWEPFTLGAGPGGAYTASLAPEHREALREACYRRLGSPHGPFDLRARAFAVRGRLPSDPRPRPARLTPDGRMG
jgi:SAM-dependent methyltransferase